LYSPLTLLGVVTTVYGLWGGELIRKYIPWFTTWMLYATMVGIILCAMLFFYKYVIPSNQAFANQQTYKFKNPLFEAVTKCMANDEIIIKKLEALEKRFEDLENK
jgi:hypothetical protein